MEQSSALTLIRSISAVTSAESAPTTSSSWVDAHAKSLGKARAIFTEPSLGDADNTPVEVTIWAREGDVIFPLKRATMDDDADLFEPADLGVVSKGWSFYATVSQTVTGTSAEVSVDVHLQRYTDYA